MNGILVLAWKVLRTVLLAPLYLLGAAAFLAVLALPIAFGITLADSAFPVVVESPSFSFSAALSFAATLFGLMGAVGLSSTLLGSARLRTLIASILYGPVLLAVAAFLFRLLSLVQEFREKPFDFAALSDPSTVETTVLNLEAAHQALATLLLVGLLAVVLLFSVPELVAKGRNRLGTVLHAAVHAHGWRKLATLAGYVLALPHGTDLQDRVKGALLVFTAFVLQLSADFTELRGAYTPSSAPAGVHEYGAVISVAINRECGELAAADFQGIVKTWAMPSYTRQFVHLPPLHPVRGEPTMVGYSRGGRTLVLATTAHAYLYDHAKQVDALSFPEPGIQVAVARDAPHPTIAVRETQDRMSFYVYRNEEWQHLPWEGDAGLITFSDSSAWAASGGFWAVNSTSQKATVVGPRRSYGLDLGSYTPGFNWGSTVYWSKARFIYLARDAKRAEVVLLTPNDYSARPAVVAAPSRSPAPLLAVAALELSDGTSVLLTGGLDRKVLVRVTSPDGEAKELESSSFSHPVSALAVQACSDGIYIIAGDWGGYIRVLRLTHAYLSDGILAERYAVLHHERTLTMQIEQDEPERAREPIRRFP